MKKKSQIEGPQKSVKELKEAYMSVKMVDKVRQRNLEQERCSEEDWPARENELKAFKKEYQKAYSAHRVTVTMICHIIDSCNLASIEYVKEIYSTFDHHSEPKKVALKKLTELYGQLLLETKLFQSAEALYSTAPKSTKIRLLILERMYKLARADEDYRKIHKLAPPSHTLKQKSLAKIRPSRNVSSHQDDLSNQIDYSCESVETIAVE